MNRLQADNVSVNNRLDRLDQFEILNDRFLEEDGLAFVESLGLDFDDVESLVVAIVVLFPSDDWSSHFGCSVASSNIELEARLVVDEMNESLVLLVLASVLDDFPNLGWVFFVRILDCDFVSIAFASKFFGLAQITPSLQTSDSELVASLCLSEQSEPLSSVVAFLVRLEDVVSLVASFLRGNCFSRVQSLQTVYSIIVYSI